MRPRSIALLTPLLLACGGGDETCVDVDLDCAPAYQPTFDNVHAETIVPRCTMGDGFCHNDDNRAGGMSLVDIDEAHESLLAGRVSPGDPECSLMVRRIESDSPSFNMPLGDDVLEPDVKCAIERWIADGAER